MEISSHGTLERRLQLLATINLKAHLSVNQHNLLNSLANSPVKGCILAKYLKIYPDSSDALILYNGFTFGFKLNYPGPRQRTYCSNLPSLRNFELEALNTCIIMKEVDLGRVVGPLLSNPLPNLRLSPIGLVPKKDGSFCLIHHLSYPKGSSVNDSIDPKLCSVNYTSFDTALSMLAQLGPDALAARLDIKSAFRLLPIHPSDIEILGFKIDNYYFIDKCLPFGCSISCSLFEKFSTFLELLFIFRSRCDNIVHYLDDFPLAETS